MNEADRQLETLAEVISINQALGVALKALALMTGEPERFLRSQLEAGLGGIAQIPLHHVTEAERVRVIESASARYTDLITTVGSNLKAK